MEWRCNFSKTESFQSIEDRLDRPLKKQSNQNGAHEVDCKTVRILRIQERASSQTKGLEWGWKQRARLGRDATGVWGSRATLYRFLLLILRKKPTVLQSTHEAMLIIKHSSHDATRILKTLGARATVSCTWWVPRDITRDKAGDQAQRYDGVQD